MESKSVKLTDYVLNEVQDICKNADCPTVDSAFRHLLAEYSKCREISKLGGITLESIRLQEMQKQQERTEIKRDLRQRGYLKVIEILARHNYSTLLNHSTEYDFAEFFKECSVLYMLDEWKSRREYFTDSPEVLRLIEILEMRPEMITEDIKKETFAIAQTAINVLGGF